MRSTTIIAVRRGNKVALAGDGQVTLGSTVVKQGASKIRRLHKDTILAGFAEYEREVISERIRAGISKARAQGKRWGGRAPGSRTKLTPRVLKTIRASLREGTSKAEVARQLGIDRSTVYEAITLIERS